MDPRVLEELNQEFARLRIGASTAENDAVVGNPPWLYTPEHMLAVARKLPDGAGAAALGQALRASHTSPPSR